MKKNTNSIISSAILISSVAIFFGYVGKEIRNEHIRTDLYSKIDNIQSIFKKDRSCEKENFEKNGKPGVIYTCRQISNDGFFQVAYRIAVVSEIGSVEMTMDIDTLNQDDEEK